MNGNIKKYIYIGGSVFIAFFVLSIILKILPWLLLAGVIGYAVVKIVGFIKEKSKKKKVNGYENTNDYSYTEQNDDYTTGEVIDVEFEDIRDKNK